MSVAIGVVIQSGPRCRFARRPREEMFAVLRLLFPMWESAGRAGFLHPPMGFFTRKALVNPASLAFFPSWPHRQIRLGVALDFWRITISSM